MQNHDVIDALYKELYPGDAEYVEVYGERMIFDSRACDRWNLITGMASVVLFVLTVVKCY